MSFVEKESPIDVAQTLFNLIDIKLWKCILTESLRRIKLVPNGVSTLPILPAKFVKESITPAKCGDKSK